MPDTPLQTPSLDESDLATLQPSNQILTSLPRFVGAIACASPTATLSFTTRTDQRQEAAAVRLKLGKIVDTDTDRVVWVGRVGFGPAPVSRALRLPLEKLIITGDSRKQTIL